MKKSHTRAAYATRDSAAISIWRSTFERFTLKHHRGAVSFPAIWGRMDCANVLHDRPPQMHQLSRVLLINPFGKQLPCRTWLVRRVWCVEICHHHHTIALDHQVDPIIKFHHSCCPHKSIAMHTRNWTQVHHSLRKCFDIDTIPIRIWTIIQNSCRSIEQIFFIWFSLKRNFYFKSKRRMDLCSAINKQTYKTNIKLIYFDGIWYILGRTSGQTNIESKWNFS